MKTDIAFTVEQSVVFGNCEVGTVGDDVIVGQFCEWRKVLHGLNNMRRDYTKESRKMKCIGSGCATPDRYKACLHFCSNKHLI